MRVGWSWLPSMKLSLVFARWVEGYLRESLGWSESCSPGQCGNLFGHVGGTCGSTQGR